jgi:hypothetical protein
VDVANPHVDHARQPKPSDIFPVLEQWDAGRSPEFLISLSNHTFGA